MLLRSDRTGDAGSRSFPGPFSLPGGLDPTSRLALAACETAVVLSALGAQSVLAFLSSHFFGLSAVLSPCSHHLANRFSGLADDLVASDQIAVLMLCFGS